MKKLKPRNKTPKKGGRKSKSFAADSQRKKTRRLWLNVLPDDLWLQVGYGQTVWEALKETSVDLPGDCGGIGKCGKCKIQVASAIEPPSPEEVQLLSEAELQQGVRLACRTKVTKDLTIYTEESALEADFYQILKTGERPIFYLDPLIQQRTATLSPDAYHAGISDMDRIKLALGAEFEDLQASLNCLQNLPLAIQAFRNQGTAVLQKHQLLAWAPADKSERSLGLIFDLGTSTLVGKLIDLDDGQELGAISRLNSQNRYGSDVISRLQYLQENPDGGLKRLHDLLLRDIRMIARRLLEVDERTPADIFVAVAVGNTTMQHLLLNLDPTGIAGAPFTPVVTDGLVVNAREAGLELNPEAQLYLFPSKSGYIGGDLIANIIASGAAEEENRIVLGLDLGTNGEIFLGNRHRLLTCSAAAGPALEGARIAHGMIAKSGAVEGVRLQNDRIELRVINNVPPKGICGSGLVDLTAVLLHCGVIDSEGLIVGPSSKTITLPEAARRVVAEQDVHHFMLADGSEAYHQKPVLLTQRDVRELQLAKGAVAAGIEMLMEEIGIGFRDIDQVYLAGALGNYIHPLSALRIGLIPPVDPQIVKSLGNAASTGASMALLSRHHWNLARDVCRGIEHVELSVRTDFNDHFIEHLDFPPENLWD